MCIRDSNRRTLVEGLIGANRYQRLSVNRGFFRRTGLVATALLLTVTLIGHNLVSLHAWHTTRGRPEPWQVHLGEPIDDRPLDKATRTEAEADTEATDRPSQNHSPSTEAAPACSETGSRQQYRPHGIRTDAATGPAAAHDARNDKNSRPDHLRPGVSGNRNG